MIRAPWPNAALPCLCAENETIAPHGRYFILSKIRWSEFTSPLLLAAARDMNVAGHTTLIQFRPTPTPGKFECGRRSGWCTKTEVSDRADSCHRRGQEERNAGSRRSCWHQFAKSSASLTKQRPGA